MNNNIKKTKKRMEIFQSKNDQIELQVQFEQDSIWMNKNQLSELFERDVKTISRHINNVFKEGELEKKSVTARIATTAENGTTYQVEHYNLDVIISVGYRINSRSGTQFRIWATQRLKEHLMNGFSINPNRLEQKHQEVQYLKTGIHILNRSIAENQQGNSQNHQEFMNIFAKGLEILDDFDHKNLDKKGLTRKKAKYPEYEDYIKLILTMNTDFSSNVFAREKDGSFISSISQIRQTFAGQELYPTLEEKAANLLYFIVKNHSFVDGNKRIAAACFLHFLDANNILLDRNKIPVISHEALASLTLFIASSKAEEADIVKQLIISILNRNKNKDLCE